MILYGEFETNWSTNNAISQYRLLGVGRRVIKSDGRRRVGLFAVRRVVKGARCNDVGVVHITTPATVLNSRLREIVRKENNMVNGVLRGAYISKAFFTFRMA